MLFEVFGLRKKSFFFLTRVTFVGQSIDENSGQVPEKRVSDPDMCIHEEEDTLHTYAVDAYNQYCVKCIIDKTKYHKIVNVDLRDIEATFDMNSRPWGDSTIAEIMNSEEDKEEIRDHKKRIVEADLSYPIILFEMEPKCYSIVDGCHRMTHAHLFGKLDQLKFRIVDINLLESCIIQTEYDE